LSVVYVTFNGYNAPNSIPGVCPFIVRTIGRVRVSVQIEFDKYFVSQQRGEHSEYNRYC